MGLKTTNYEVKKLGITIPEAYAMIKNLSIDGNSGYVTFAIQANRDNALKLTPIDTIDMHFVVDRNENPFVTAYNKAKGQTIIEQYNRTTGAKETTTVDGILYGWVDDIVEME